MNTEVLLNELEFSAVRSSGPGGQHVNKTSSKIVLHFNLNMSEALSSNEKDMLRERIPNRISADGMIVMSCSDTRSQHRNKARVISMLLELLERSLRPRKKRKKTKPSRQAVEKRLKEKREQAIKKKSRKQPPTD